MNLSRVDIAFAVALSAVSSETWAQRCPHASQAERLEAEALALRTRGDDMAALRRLVEAHGLCHSARALARLAITEAALGRWRLAEEHLVAALATDDPWVHAHRARLDADRRNIEAHLATLEISTNAAGAELVVGDVALGPINGTRRVRIGTGEVTFSVRAAGYRSVTRTVQVTGGAVLRESVGLTREPAAMPVVEEAPRPAPVLAVEAAPMVVPVVLTPTEPTVREARPAEALPRSHGTSQRIAGYTLLGIGAALAAGTGVWLGTIESRVDSHNSGLCRAAQTTDASLRNTCQSNREALDDERVLAVMGLGVGGALVVASVIVLASAPSTGSRRTALRCGPSGGLWGIDCALNF